MWGWEGAWCLSPSGPTWWAINRTSTRPPPPLNLSPCPYRTAGRFSYPLRSSKFIRDKGRGWASCPGDRYGGWGLVLALVWDYRTEPMVSLIPSSSRQNSSEREEQEERR